jgi:hypothetical protein
MGVVFRARDPATGREVALKTLLRPQPQALARFRREAEALALVDHPGIVKVHATGEADGRPFIVCELVEGAQALDRAASALPLEARAALVRDACRALGHAHARGVVHRDVKAENLLVDAAGRLRVTDFGLAVLEASERLTRTGAVVGTPFTMAPEQIAGDRGAVGPQTDVWALGVVLYQVLTGALPFSADSLPELCGRICEGRPVPPSRLVPGISAPLEAVCLRALSRLPADRWPHGDAMADALDSALRGGRVAGRRRSLRPILWLVAPAASLGLLVLALLYDPAAVAPRPVKPARPLTAETPRPGAPAPAAQESPPKPGSPAPEAQERPADPESALVVLLRGQADTGTTGAMMQLGRMYADGTGGVTRDPARAREWFGRAARAGDSWGKVTLGKMLVDGDGGPPDLLGGLALIRAAAEEGHPAGMAEYSRMHQKGMLGVQVRRNLDHAIDWMQDAVEGEPDTRTRAGYRADLADLFVERGGAKDLLRAREAYEAAVSEGSMAARLHLARHLLTSTFGPPDPARARELVEEVRRDEPGRDSAKVTELLRRCDEVEAGAR